jgi:hypothetical protein
MTASGTGMNAGIGPCYEVRKEIKARLTWGYRGVRIEPQATTRQGSQLLMTPREIFE